MSVLAVAAPAFADSGNAPIIGGTADSADPAVVQVLAYPGDKSKLSTCTGVLISSTEVLTAAHCLVQTPAYVNPVYGVFFGADANSFGGQISNYEPHLAAVASVHVNPGYISSFPYTADIGVVILAQPSTVTPLPFARDVPTAALVGMTAHIVGYGQTTQGTVQNARFAADTIVASIDVGAAGGDTISIGDVSHHTCLGDSGGPAIVNGVVLGIDSYTDNGTVGMPCPDATVHFRRTASYVDFLDNPTGSGSGSGSGSGNGSGTTGGGGDGGGGCATTTSNGAGFALVASVLAALSFVRRRRAR